MLQDNLPEDAVYKDAKRVNCFEDITLPGVLMKHRSSDPEGIVSKTFLTAMKTTSTNTATGYDAGE